MQEIITRSNSSLCSGQQHKYADYATTHEYSHATGIELHLTWTQYQTI